MTISFVLAMSKNRVIGSAGQLPWKLASDMKRFTHLTTGHPVIMGSKTYESLPTSYRPLKGRTNIVLSRDPKQKYSGAECFSSLADAIRFAARQPGGEEVMIIGGGQIFELAIPLVHKIYLTQVETELTGDTYFPLLDSDRWSVKADGGFSADKKNQFDGTFLTYTRTNRFPIVEPENGRNEQYRQQLEQILESKQCPFCPGGETLKEQEIIKQTEMWLAKENSYPIPNSLYHFMIFPARHIEDTSDILAKEWQDLTSLRLWLKNKYKFNGDVMYIRSGEPMVTGATVTHLHWHLIVPAERIEVSFGRFS